jgi:protein TonB
MATLKNPKADLKRLYRRAFELSLVFSLTAIIAAFKFSPDASKIELINPEKPDLITVEDIINTVQKPEIPPPPKAPEIIAASIDDVPDDIILDDIDDIKPVKLPDNPPKPKVDLSDEIFIEIPDELPSPVGGLISIQEKVHYTEIARRIELQGTVFIQAKIDKNGDVVEAIVLKGLGGGLDEEALNAVKSTTFHPGEQRGRPVNVKMVIPIKFVLR